MMGRRLSNCLLLIDLRLLGSLRTPALQPQSVESARKMMDDEDFYREIMILRACRDTNILQVCGHARCCVACWQCCTTAATCRLAAQPSVLHMTATALHLCSPCSAALQFQGACFKDDRTLLVTEYMEVGNFGVLIIFGIV